MQWFRWYHGTATDMKFGRIARQTGQTRERVLFVWAMLLESASDNDTRGTFDVEPDDIADILNCETDAIDRIMAAMRDTHIIDGNTLVSWDKRQPSRDDSAARQRKHRAGNADVTRTPCDSDAPVTRVTVLDTDTETEVETEKKVRTRETRLTPSPGFDAFWSAYPVRKGRGAALKAWAKAILRAPPEEIIAAAARYRPAESKFTKHPATWLNQDCWTDEPDHHDEPDAFARAAFAVATGREYGLDERGAHGMGAAPDDEPGGSEGGSRWGGNVAALPRPSFAR